MHHQMENFSKFSTNQNAVLKGDGDDTLVNSVVDQSFLALLITEYDKHLEALNEQLKYYQQQMGEMKLQLENVIKENERLHGELKDVVEKQLEALPFDSEMGKEVYTDEQVVSSLQEQLQLANQEKDCVVGLWQAALQELNTLQEHHQECVTKAQMGAVESQKQQDQQLTQNLHAVKNIEMASQHFLKAIANQNVEIQQLRKQFRQSKLDLRVAAAKVEELTTVTEQLHGQMHKKEEDMASAREREEASERFSQQLQSSIKILESNMIVSRFSVTSQEAKELKTEKARLERVARELQARCTALEKENYAAAARVRDSMKLLDEAHLKRDQALLKDKQKEEEIEKMKKTICQLIQDSALKSKEDVESTKKLCEVQISQVMEELSALRMECDEKQEQIERVIRGKKAVEEELEKAYREGRGSEEGYRKLEEMHHRCLAAERSKDDLQLSLKRAENRIKQLEINSSEEISRSHEMIQTLQTVLESERENCGFVSEQRLKLQQENEQLQKEIEELRKIAVEAQKKAKLKISTMEHEFSIKQHGFEVQLQEMEDSNRNSTTELRRLLMTQQKAANRWREETKKLTESTEIRISSLKNELSRQKLHTQELLSQLEIANEKIVENEKLILEHQEKANRLQKRLSQAEDRAASASHQLSVITVQRRKAASMVNLENI
ncbi:sodium channel and clathrin linker 1 isoform X2 [Perognathus longimembris pacificus]|uniref:sodium channel and clathrin linker 1 isoform X2 n=1 Tax=Perognathus longimembris pacificus TaxID=214514 RepID=UPI002018A129|nr:sodium channel and clathrin linker 1 isoform X2 [Perognathus longimembris pacificus]